MNSVAQEYFYFTPSKVVSQNQTQSRTLLRSQSQSDSFQQQMKSECDQDSQMTQSLFSFQNRFASISSTADACFKTTLFQLEDEEEEQDNQQCQFNFKVDFKGEQTLNNFKDNDQETDDERDSDEENDSASSKMQTQKLIKQISKKSSTKKVSKKILSATTLSTAVSINFLDSVKSLQSIKEQATTRKPVLSENAARLIAQIKDKKQTSKTLSPLRNPKVNAILNQKSLKDKFKDLLGSRQIQLQSSQNKELLSLMQAIESIVIQRNQLLLSDLMNEVSGLTIYKMNAIMNINPQLYNLSLQINNQGFQDMLITLPISENIVNQKLFLEKRLCEYKQNLFFDEHKSLKNSISPVTSFDNLTQIIRESLAQKKEELSLTFAKLIDNNSINSAQTSLKKYADIVREQFDNRNVSNMFRLHLIEQMSQLANSNLICAEQALNELVFQYPSWLQEVNSSVLGQIIRINYNFSTAQIM